MLNLLPGICLLRPKKLYLHSFKRDNTLKNGLKVSYWTYKQTGTTLILLYHDQKNQSTYSYYMPNDLRIRISQRSQIFIRKNFRVRIRGTGGYF